MSGAFLDRQETLDIVRKNAGKENFALRGAFKYKPRRPEHALQTFVLIPGAEDQRK